MSYTTKIFDYEGEAAVIIPDDACAAYDLKEGDPINVRLESPVRKGGKPRLVIEILR
jgi:hypothetical protein